MATITAFPDGTSVTGPTINRLIVFPIEYRSETFRNEDGGADVNVQPCGLKRWQLEYDGLTEDEMDDLREHYDLAKGQVNDFSFYDKHAAAASSGVKYESFKVAEHVKTWVKPLTIVLVKFV